jgi:predicted transposase/invertase (TIGR01784 family)
MYKGVEKMEEETNQKFYTCMYDRAFKEVMLNEKNKEILKSVLTSALKVEIYEIELLNQELNSGNVHVKRKHIDAHLKTNEGVIEVEVNAYPEKYVYPRNMAYMCNMYATNTLVGEEYTESTKFIQINFTYRKEEKEAYNIYKIQNEEGKEFVKNFIIYEFNMKYYMDLWYNKNKKGIEDNKYIIMMGLEEKELKQLSREDKVVGEYMEELKKVNANPRFIEYMSEEEDERKIRNSQLKEARETGLEEGIEKGHKEGIEEGKQEGSKEKSMEIARNLLKMNLSIEQIKEATGLTEQEIKIL